MEYSVSYSLIRLLSSGRPLIMSWRRLHADSSNFTSLLSVFFMIDHILILDVKHISYEVMSLFVTSSLSLSEQ
jgi:hypothetical protein